MSQPFAGEIQMFAGNFAPVDWAFCDGRLLQISEYDTLFSLIGTTYGGDGVTTFALPDLRGRLPLHQGSGYSMGQSSGSESVTLTGSQIPAHSHAAQASGSTGSQTGPGGGLWASSALNQFAAGDGTNLMANANVGNAGGSQPHDNMMPYLAVSFVICLYGIYPTRP